MFRFAVRFTRRAVPRRSFADKAGAHPAPNTPQSTPLSKYVSEELLKKHGHDFFLGKHALPPNSPPSWQTPALALIYALSAAAALYITLPPEDFHPTAKEQKKAVQHKVTGTGPTTHGEYEVHDEEAHKSHVVAAATSHVADAETKVVESAVKTDESVSSESTAAPSEAVSAAADGKIASHGAETAINNLASSHSELSAPAPAAAAPVPSSSPLVDPESKLIKATYVLVGGGTASYSAMKAIQERDANADIWIITSEAHAPYMRPPLSKELWFSEDADRAALKFKDWGGTSRDLFYEATETFQLIAPEAADDTPVDRILPKLLTSRKVEKLDVEAQVLTLSDGKLVKYSKLLLATGGTPKVLPAVKALPESVRQNFSTFRSLDDFKTLEKVVSSGNKKVVVIGGGFLGSELSCALAQYGKRFGTSVTQVFPEDGNMGLVFPRYLMDWTTARVRQEGVNVRTNAQIAAIDATQEGGLQLKLSDGSELKADHVVMAIGIEPNVQLAKNAGLELDTQRGGVVTNAELEARTNVYVAGDAGSFHDIALGRRRVEHHDHAILSGRTAGLNMAGSHKPFRQQSMFWSDLGPEIGYEAVGLLDASLPTVGVWAKATEKDTPKHAHSEAPSTEAVPPSTSESDDYGKGVVFYLRDDKIVGVLLWNIFHRTPIARRLINEGQGVGDVAELANLFKIHEE